MLDLDFFWNHEEGKGPWSGDLSAFLKRGWAEATTIKGRLEGKLTDG